MLREVREVHLGGALSGMDGEQWKWVAKGANCNSIRKTLGEYFFLVQSTLHTFHTQQPNCRISFEERPESSFKIKWYYFHFTRAELPLK